MLNPKGGKSLHNRDFQEFMELHASYEPEGWRKYAVIA
jgi:hypothetical protein